MKIFIEQTDEHMYVRRYREWTCRDTEYEKLAQSSAQSRTVPCTLPKLAPRGSAVSGTYCLLFVTAFRSPSDNICVHTSQPCAFPVTTCAVQLVFGGNAAH